MNPSVKARVENLYKEHFSNEPEVTVFSPGRINLIGEHTDYNEGFVLPAAVDLGIYLTIGRSSDAACHVIASDLEKRYSFQLDEVVPIERGGWRNYVLGVVHFLQLSGIKVEPFWAVFSGDIPKGAGMSSSAALENAFSFGLNELYAGGLSKIELSLVGQKAEHEYVGVKCGIMDQFSSMMGKVDHAMLLDCRTLQFDLVPIKLDDCQLLLINSNVHHNLASSEYNIRREQVEEGVSHIRKQHHEVTSLRDVSLGMLNGCRTQLTPVVYKRCLYVLKENQRVLAFAELLSLGKLSAAGDLLRQSQEGMKEEYEITCPEIDFLADYANSFEGVLGARMMGGGFGGCVIVLIEKHKKELVLERVLREYQNQFGFEATSIEFDLSEGVRHLD